jgi:hypothetical protein
MRRLLRFFFTGPGALLTVILIGLGICWLIKSGRDRQEAEARKHQIERPLGSVKPTDEVDEATAQKERILADRRLIPGTKTESLPPQTPRGLQLRKPKRMRFLSWFRSMRRSKPLRSHLLPRSQSDLSRPRSGYQEEHLFPALSLTRSSLRT